MWIVVVALDGLAFVACWRSAFLSDAKRSAEESVTSTLNVFFPKMLLGTPFFGHLLPLNRIEEAARYIGMIVCFFSGSSTVLSFSWRSARRRRKRVSSGSMIAST
ncbi:hypothetical protein CUROG_01030 [Corynebacterium urogenitale]|uniref:Uncharacterized protein n=1 Tax=Corynebacterium urogenitale TaxID=2487892 RepID=A0A5J6Z7L5_9CORY|nr:hypothetical protein CUROG_01030 [Corynebacterium urogenitale]